MTALQNFIWLLAVLTILSGSPMYAETWSAKVIGIKDGDTISVLHEGKEETIRLNGIDCQMLF